jgi:transcriptional regulator with XRE-family HTH domain
MANQTTPLTHPQIVRALIKLQGTRSDTEYAAMLGISASYWSLIRKGRRKLLRPTARILKALGLKQVYVRNGAGRV